MPFLHDSFSTESIETKGTPLARSGVISIKNSGSSEPSTDLKNEVAAGITASSPSLPSLLLWGNEGIRQFNKLTLHPNYYPSRTEMVMINEYADAVASMTPPDGILLELGCGSLQKTNIILSAFHRRRQPVTYYALDVSETELKSSIENLRHNFSHSEYVSILGLYGTYDDCIAWLRSLYTWSSRPRGFPQLITGQTISFLWIGNSIANMHPPEATAMLSKFHNACSVSKLHCRFFIGSDSCGDSATVLKSYNPNYQDFTDFIFTGLNYANDILGDTVFRQDDFRIETEFDSSRRLLEVYYVARRRVQLDWSDQTVHNSFHRTLEQGQRILIIYSYKWSSADFARICENAGMQVARRYVDGTIDYSKRVLIYWKSEI